MVILSIEIGILALVKPKTMVMALPNSGRKAKNPIRAPRPARNFRARANWRVETPSRVIHSVRPSVPIQ